MPIANRHYTAGKGLYQSRHFYRNLSHTSRRIALEKARAAAFQRHPQKSKNRQYADALFPINTEKYKKKSQTSRRPKGLPLFPVCTKELSPNQASQSDIHPKELPIFPVDTEKRLLHYKGKSTKNTKESPLFPINTKKLPLKKKLKCKKKSQKSSRLKGLPLFPVCTRIPPPNQVSQTGIYPKGLPLFPVNVEKMSSHHTTKSTKKLKRITIISNGYSGTII